MSEDLGIGKSGNIGSGSNISGKVHQEFHIGGGGKGKWYLTKDILIPVIVGLSTAIAGAYAKYRFDLLTAPQQTAEGARTLVGAVGDALTIARSSSANAELLARLGDLLSQAKAVEASALLIADGGSGLGQHVSFWLRPGQGGIRLGDNVSIGITRVLSNGELEIIYNNSTIRLGSGGRIDYIKGKEKCVATYVAKATDSSVVGFNVSCKS